MSQPASPALAVIVITLNEGKLIESTLKLLQERLPGAERLVVDGGSHDSTVELAQRWHPVITVSGGRGPQLNAGAAATQAEALLFLHADTIPDPGAAEAILQALADPAVLGGAFRMRFDESRPAFRVISDQVTRRSLRTKSYTGDQGIFARRSAFTELGGYKPWPFMEDVDFSERLGRSGPVVLLDTWVETSARRHRAWGLWRMQLTVILIRALYMFHASPHFLAKLWPEVR